MRIRNSPFRVEIKNLACLDDNLANPALKFHPYKLQSTEELKPNDDRQKRAFANWAVEHLEVDTDVGSPLSNNA